MFLKIAQNSHETACTESFFHNVAGCLWSVSRTLWNIYDGDFLWNELIVSSRWLFTQIISIIDVRYSPKCSSISQS